MPGFKIIFDLKSTVQQKYFPKTTEDLYTYILREINKRKTDRVMRYRIIIPPAELADYVRFFWVFEGTVSAGHPYVHRTMADGCAEILFHYKGHFTELLPGNKSETSFTSGISGQTSAFHRFSIDKSFGIFGVYLYPYALRRLFSVPSVELTNQMPDLVSFFGREGKELEEKIMLAADDSDRCCIMAEFLRRHLNRSKPDRHPVIFAIRHIIHSGLSPGVGELGSQFNMSSRQLERKFKEYAGFSPKRYMRIIRFQSSIDKYERGGNPSLTQIAYDCGYYDQSHFIHDFEEFSGYHPMSYFSGNNEGTEWRDE